MSKIYDVIILGGGPAGLAAGLYAGRSRLSTLIIEKGQDGGQIAITDEIENYPGQITKKVTKQKTHLPPRGYYTYSVAGGTFHGGRCSELPTLKMITAE